MHETAETAITASVKASRYIRASEVGAFVYCKRNWHLARQNAPSRLEPERARGTQFHERHGQRIQSAARAGKLASWCAVAAVILLALGLLVSLR
jgi:hypothetical protein